MTPHRFTRTTLAAMLLAPGLAYPVICEIAIPPSNPDAAYIDHFNGTVTHVATGLVWKKCSEGQVWSSVDNSCSASGDATSMDWPAALLLADGHSFAGRDDWRLPNINELRSLVERCRIAPAINDALFPQTPALAGYWSSSPKVGAPTTTWFLESTGGQTAWVDRDAQLKVRLLRGGAGFGAFDARLDYLPDAIADFPAATDVVPGAQVESSESRHATGLTTVTGIRIEGGGDPQYRIGDGAWTAQPGVVGDGDRIRVRLTAGAPGETRGATLTVGGQSASFSATAAHPTIGACGVAQGLATLLAPTSGLCVAGTPGAVSSLDGAHAWSCSGSFGGASAACSAPGADASGFGGTGNATVELLSGDGCSVESAELVTPPAGLPPGVSLPYGALQFVLDGCATGGSATLRVNYQAPVVGMAYWKYVGGSWTTMPATLAATFTIVDNGPYDADPTPGRIVDPGGPGIVVQETGFGGAAAIPVLSGWMLAVLAFGLLIASRMRQRRG